MKKFIIFIALIVGVYKFYPYVISPDQIKALTSNGAFDESGNPHTILFIADYCKQPCDDTIKYLKKRRIQFTTIDISKDETGMELYKSYDGERGIVPWIVTGYNHVKGSDFMKITSMLAESYGTKTLTSAENRAMKTHFSSDGAPRLIMYGTKHCGYCLKAREYFSDNDILFVELDIDKSKTAKNHFKTLKGGGTPLIYIGYRRIIGFNKNEIDSAVQEFKL